MKRFSIKKNLVLYSLLLQLCFVDKSSEASNYKLLNLEKGDNCGRDQNYVCTESSDCVSLKDSIKSNNYLDICSFDGSKPIVCCPPAIDKTLPSTKFQTGQIAAEKCRQYSALPLTKANSYFIAVVGGIEALSQEFPHMALIGYGETTEDKFDWKCGGSLISERWILTAAHCYKDGSGVLAKWVRLGELDIVSDRDIAQPIDYSVTERVLHPNYVSTEIYNDIALLRLDSDVKFSSFARPICLNSDQSLNPKRSIATGWGKTATDESPSDVLLKITLNHVPEDTCNTFYSSNSDSKIKLGILSDSMMCAGSTRENEDTCQGDSGGPLQIKIRNGPNSYYTQIGVTSFGSTFCGDRKPGVYTRVSKFIPWIEEIVWSVS